MPGLAGPTGLFPFLGETELLICFQPPCRFAIRDSILGASILDRFTSSTFMTVGAQGGCLMTVTPFDERSSSQSSLMAYPQTPDGRLPGDDKKEHAVAEILAHGVLSHAFGHHGEYKVRTTMTTRRTWQYQCCVLRHGKAIKGAFFPIIVEHQSPLPRSSLRPLGSEDMRLSFAQEAVDVHYTRCAALREYLVLSALYDQAPRQSRGWYTLFAPLLGIAMLVAFGFWAHAFRIDGGQPPEPSPLIVADQLPIGKPRQVPLSGSSRTTSPDPAPGQDGTLGPIEPAEVPKAISVTDLLALQNPRENADRASPPGSSGSTIQVGDMLHVTGWIQRISRVPDNTYHLYVSPTRQAGGRVLVAAIPPPNQAQGSPGAQAQLQAVRTFIRQQLLRQQEPSLRGSVMQRPTFVQLTGQLWVPSAPTPAPSRGKRSQATPAGWEIRPTLEVQFATP
jgi:hypothetical protein